VDAVIQVRGLRKNYGGLRPLRLSALSVMPGERVAIVGLDAPAAEAFVNMLTGAMLPDEGDVQVFGRATSAIVNADDWLSTLDRIGMVSARAILAEELTVAQGIAMAFTLSLDPIPDAVLADVRRLAREAGLSGDLEQRIADVTPLVKAQCRLARALAQQPSVLLLEHANALVPTGPERFGRAIAALATARGLAVIALTADMAFARAVADRVLVLAAGATGDLKERSGWRRWLR
jgi:ABC-type uncharacterized transport system ATPase subunit